MKKILIIASICYITSIITSDNISPYENKNTNHTFLNLNKTDGKPFIFSSIFLNNSHNYKKKLAEKIKAIIVDPDIFSNIQCSDTFIAELNNQK